MPARGIGQRAPRSWRCRPRRASPGPMRNTPMTRPRPPSPANAGHAQRQRRIEQRARAEVVDADRDLATRQQERLGQRRDPGAQSLSARSGVGSVWQRSPPALARRAALPASRARCAATASRQPAAQPGRGWRGDVQPLERPGCVRVTGRPLPAGQHRHDSALRVGLRVDVRSWSAPVPAARAAVGGIEVLAAALRVARRALAAAPRLTRSRRTRAAERGAGDHDEPPRRGWMRARTAWWSSPRACTARGECTKPRPARASRDLAVVHEPERPRATLGEAVGHAGDVIRGTAPRRVVGQRPARDRVRVAPRRGRRARGRSPGRRVRLGSVDSAR